MPTISLLDLRCSGIIGTFRRDRNAGPNESIQRSQGQGRGDGGTKDKENEAEEMKVK
jgi:hypothetical protein